MPWNPDWPLGSTSVKANRPTGDENTKYIQTTMGNSIIGTNTDTTRDHFWNVGTNEDGRHRWIQSPAFTVGASPADAVLGAGMDAVLYAKTTNGRVEWFHRNAQGIYQAVPSFKQGTVEITSFNTYTNIDTVPANVYGEILLYHTSGGQFSSQWGWFWSGVATVEAWSNVFRSQSDTNGCSIKLGNGSQASGLNIRGRLNDAAVTTWQYRIIYRAL